MDSDFVVGINKSIDAAKGETGKTYPAYLHNTLVTEKLDELAEAITEGGGGASALSDLTDVDISGTVQGGKVLKYNAVEEKWAPGDDSGNVQSDWNENDPTSGAYILNKPSIPNSPIELTQAEYDALTPAEKMNDTPYLITDANGDGSQFQPVIYSTSEREIGVWTDGKPLYEKTYIHTFTNIARNTEEIVADISGLNIDTVVNSTGVCRYSFTGQPDRYEILGYHFYYYIYPSGNLTFTQQMTSETTDRTYDLIIKLQYTKTTDTAGSGIWTPQGVPAVHYSTDEQVVGTWIDGSPVYERTVVSTGNMTKNAWTGIVDASSWNIGTVVSFSGSYMRYWTDGYSRACLPYFENTNVRCSVRFNSADLLQYYMLDESYNNGKDITVIVRYTKSST